MDAVFEDVEGDVSLWLVDDERWAEADAGFAAAEDQEAAFEGEVDDLVAHGAGGRAGFLIFDDLDTDHEAAAADFADDGVFGDPGAEALKHFFTGRKCTVLLLDDSTAEEDVRLHSVPHGVMQLEQLPHEYGSERRRLRVVKMRGMSFRGGYHDLVIETGLKPYDIAALIPIITGAGGVVTTWEGKPAQNGGRIIAAGDPRVHEAAMKLLNA